jgi:hypothetical protein
LLKIYKTNIEEETTVSEIIMPQRGSKLEMPLFLESVSAGFPSPADDYLEGKLDLNDALIRNPAATFFVRVTGDSMIEAGIHSGDILVVDRSLNPKDGSIVIAVILNPTCTPSPRKPLLFLARGLTMVHYKFCGGKWHGRHIECPVDRHGFCGRLRA